MDAYTNNKSILLVLDVNGLLLDKCFENDRRRTHRRPDGRIGRFLVYKRPLCDEFLDFCFDNFAVGIWSSAQRHNVHRLVDFTFGERRKQLLFQWHQTDCTDTGYQSSEKSHKTIYLKELSKLWSMESPDVPWERGVYGQYNTLLIDDSPYKALRNPPYTGIFPYPYKVSYEDDSTLGELKEYLEGLLNAPDVQEYVQDHHFGQSHLTEESTNWDTFCHIVDELPQGYAKPLRPSDAIVVFPVNNIKEDDPVEPNQVLIREKRRKRDAEAYKRDSENLQQITEDEGRFYYSAKHRRSCG